MPGHPTHQASRTSGAGPGHGTLQSYLGNPTCGQVWEVGISPLEGLLQPGFLGSIPCYLTQEVRTEARGCAFLTSPQ